MDVDYKLIGNRIQTVRKTRGYTQEWLAEKLDVSVGYISQIERGITKMSLDLLAKISSIFNCDLSELVVGASVNAANYLDYELNSHYALLSKRDKKIVLALIKILIDSED